MNSRGVSEVLGFVLVFAVVTATIGVVYTGGFAGLQDAEQAEQHQNMERAFDVFDDNLEDLYRESVPSRSTEVKLAGGTLRVGEPITIQVQSNSTAAGLCNTTRSLTLSTRPVTYVNDETQITYTTGAIIRTDGQSSAMLNSPDWITGSDRFVMPILTTTVGDRGSVGGQTTVLIVAERERQSVRCTFDDPDDRLEVNVTVNSPRSDAWKTFFEDEGFMVTQSSGDSVSATFNSTRLFVTDTTVEVNFEQ